MKLHTRNYSSLVIFIFLYTISTLAGDVKLNHLRIGKILLDKCYGDLDITSNKEKVARTSISPTYIEVFEKHIGKEIGIFEVCIVVCCINCRLRINLYRQ